MSQNLTIKHISVATQKETISLWPCPGSKQHESTTQRSRLDRMIGGLQLLSSSSPSTMLTTTQRFYLYRFAPRCRIASFRARHPQYFDVFILLSKRCSSSACRASRDNVFLVFTVKFSFRDKMDVCHHTFVTLYFPRWNPLKERHDVNCRVCP
jgi:hypothetical protein